MNKICTFIFIALTLLLASCEKEDYLNIGYNVPIDKHSTGHIDAHVSIEKERLFLNGSISLLEGELTIDLIDPYGISVYTKRIIAPIKMPINENYIAKSGCWKLKYESKGGIGTIDLHLYN